MREARRLILGFLAAAMLVGCGAGKEEPGGVAGVQTVKDTARAADAFATQSELRWLGRLARWSQRFSQAGSRVHEFESGPEFERVLAGDSGALDRYRGLLRPIRNCPDTFERDVGEAPTDRLRHSARNYSEACGHFREGIDLLVEAVEQDDQGLAERARYQLEDASRKVDMAAGALPPGEKQKLPVERGASAKSRIDPRYGEVASKVAGKEVEARCWSREDWRKLLVEEKVFTAGRVNESVLGFASAGGMRINLAPSVCRNLDALVYRELRPADPARQHELALALVVLVHEGRHAAGILDEPTAECEAIQLATQAGRGLGVEGEYARTLVDVYWQAYPHLPPEYRSPECRDGGELDLSPGDGRFP